MYIYPLCLEPPLTLLSTLFYLGLFTFNWLEKAMAPHSSTLAWKIPWTEEPGGLRFMGSLGVKYDWGTSLSLFRITILHLYCVGVCNISILISHCCSIAQLCPTLCDSMNFRMPDFSVLHYLPEFAQTHFRRVGDDNQQSHPLPALLLLPSIFSSIRVFSNESALRIRWPKQWISHRYVSSLVNLPLTPLNILSGLSHLILIALWGKNWY